MTYEQRITMLENVEQKLKKVVHESAGNFAVVMSLNSALASISAAKAALREDRNAVRRLEMR